jgi:integrase/recombinase XerD
MIQATENLKHRSMICLAYAGGLRVSEIVNLKLMDIDSKRMVMTLRQAKGKKDRQVMLSDKLLVLLRTYFKEYKPKQWLFEGQYGDQYSTRSVQEVYSRPRRRQVSGKKGRFMRCGTALPRICWKEVLIFSALRNCWATTV